MGTRNEHPGNEASSRRARSETADGRCNPSYGKGSGSSREASIQGSDRRSRDEVHDFVALE